MTTFVDGPAKGQTLMLKRTPRFLRVVVAAGKWDALDQPTDTPRPDEEIHAYELLEQSGMVHLNFGRRGGGFYPLASYHLVPERPADDVMRAPKRWADWCEAEQRRREGAKARRREGGTAMKLNQWDCERLEVLLQEGQGLNVWSQQDGFYAELQFRNAPPEPGRERQAPSALEAIQAAIDAAWRVPNPELP